MVQISDVRTMTQRLAEDARNTCALKGTKSVHNNGVSTHSVIGLLECSMIQRCFTGWFSAVEAASLSCCSRRSCSLAFSCSLMP
jgi:hypothetical protein